MDKQMRLFGTSGEPDQMLLFATDLAAPGELVYVPIGRLEGFLETVEPGKRQIASERLSKVIKANGETTTMHAHIEFRISSGAELAWFGDLPVLAYHDDEDYFMALGHYEFLYVKHLLLDADRKL